jgi:hypothetical protein
MDGTVHSINPDLGLVAIDTMLGFSILEQTTPDFEVGDFVSWTPDCPSGSCDVRNVSRGRNARVYFQNHCVPGTFLKVNLQI